MYQVQDGYSQYKEVDLAARTAAASPLELVLVLFAGLLDELERAKSHIEGRRFEKKAQSINKCIDILNALTSSLEFETGGELVVNLSRLYDHCVYRLYEASGELSAEKIDEVMLILSNLREGWKGFRASWVKTMEKQRRQLFALVEAMNEALDKQRWRRLPALHQQLMRQFHDYVAAETDAAQLCAVKAQLYGAFNALIKRREQRAEVLKARMEQHQRHQEGVLAYSIVNLLSEKS